MKIRNIEVTWRHENNSAFFATQTFFDWYDFADFLKQEQEAGRVVCVKGWRYVGKNV